MARHRNSRLGKLRQDVDELFATVDAASKNLRDTMRSNGVLGGKRRRVALEFLAANIRLCSAAAGLQRCAAELLQTNPGRRRAIVRR